MNIDKTKVYNIALASVILAVLHLECKSVELSMFHFKMAVVCLAIGFCLKSEEKR